jgi:hypothetical protein
VKGKANAVRIFQPLGLADQLDSERRDLADRHHRALALFRARSWSAAEDIFRVLAPRPGYGRIAEIYLAYMKEFIKTDPGAEWDGAYTMRDT